MVILSNASGCKKNIQDDQGDRIPFGTRVHYLLELCVEGLNCTYKYKVDLISCSTALTGIPNPALRVRPSEQGYSYTNHPSYWSVPTCSIHTTL